MFKRNEYFELLTAKNVLDVSLLKKTMNDFLNNAFFDNSFIEIN